MRQRLTALLVLCLNAAAYACPMCKDSVPASDAQSAGGLPSGFNNSIYLMLGALFGVIGMITWTLVKAGRTSAAAAPRRRAFPVVPKHD